MILDTHINSDKGIDQRGPRISSLADGGFIVFYYSSDYREHFGQRFDVSGNLLGTEFSINSYPENIQWFPWEATLANGTLLDAWVSEDEDGKGIYAQLYDATNNPLGTKFRVNSYTTSNQWDPSVTGLADGGFVVTWISVGQDGYNFIGQDGYNFIGIYGQRYDTNGKPLGTEFHVNSIIGILTAPSVSTLADNSFVVVWNSLSGNGSVSGQRYDTNGNKLGTEFLISSNSHGSSVAALADGGFIVTYSRIDSKIDGGDIYGQRYDVSGNPQGLEFRINSDSTRHKQNSSVTALDDGGFVVTWESGLLEGYGFVYIDVHGKRFDANGNEVEWNGTYNPEPENPLPENPNLELETTSDNIVTAALNLSARAYSDDHYDNQLEVIDKINEHIKGWKPLEVTDLASSANNSGFKKIGIEDKGDLLRYEFLNASATVGLTILDGKRTLGIAFEGTNSPLSLDGLLDLVSDVSYLKGYYNLLKDSEFIPSVVDYINTNSIEQVLVTGHSLGGAAAQSFMNDYGQHDARFIGVTFGSPGTLQLQPLPKDRFVNIQHNGDPVVNASQYITHQNIVHGAIINADVEDSGVDGLLREHTLYTPLDNSKASYRETIEFITSQLDTKSLFQDMNIVPGTDGDDKLNARAGKNGEILLGGRGNDTLKGGLIDGSDTQLFKGGLGNDTIDGDGGVDYAMYGGARSNFVLQKDNMVLLNDFLFPDKWTISDQRLASGSEGVDTLESIERLNFTDSALAHDLHDSAGKTAKLIGAVFGAESISKPEYVAAGLYYLDNGTSYEDLAAGAIQLAGANTPEQVVTLLWSNIVGSSPTTSQMQPLVDDLISGNYTTGSLGVLAAEHGINLTNINLTGLAESGIAFDPSYYQPIG